MDKNKGLITYLAGIELASVGMVFFAIVVVLADWATIYLYLMGSSSHLKE